VVATDVGGAAEVIVERESGYLVASGDDEAMAARIIELLCDEEKARVMGERGREIIRTKFSCEAQLEATERLYDQLLRRGQNNQRNEVGRPISDLEISK
jgi:glycosyltransferase involved in cell wall biosynthesis